MADNQQPIITKEQIEAYKQQRLEECKAKIDALLEEYDCQLSAMPQIVDGRIVAVTGLVLK